MADDPNSRFRLTSSQKLILSLTGFIALGRVTIPTRPLTGWPGIYESLAHIALGVMIGAAIYSPKDRKAAIGLVLLLSVFEVLMFKMNGG